MQFSKVSCFTLAAITISLVLSHPLNSAKVLQRSTKTVFILQADGGAPVPPVPKRTKVVDARTSVLQADGGAPVPPVPKRTKVVDAGMDVLQVV